MADAAVSGETKELFSEERTVGGGNLRMKTVLLPDGSTQVQLDASEVPDNGNLVLHWGVSASAKKPHEWGAAPESVRPQGTNLFGDGKATRTPFNGGSLVVHVPADVASTEDGPATLVGIALRCNPGSEEQWLHADDGAGVNYLLSHIHTDTHPCKVSLPCKDTGQFFKSTIQWNQTCVYCLQSRLLIAIHLF